MKKQILIGAVILLAVVVGGASWYWLANKTTESQTTDVVSNVFRDQYPKVVEDHRFVISNPEEVLKIIDSGSGMVFLGFPGCPWCQQLAPIVDEAARAEGIDRIYYLNIQQSRADNDETYQKLIDKLKDYLPADEDGNPRISVPDVTAYRNGEVVGRFEQEATAEGEQVTPDTYWTTERRERAIVQLKSMMRQMNEFAGIQDDIKNGAILLDVRTDSEFKTGHFTGATNLDIEDISGGKFPEVAKDTRIYVYCRSGNRSAQATSLLEKAGFSNITDLGGLDDVEAIGGMRG